MFFYINWKATCYIIDNDNDNDNDNEKDFIKHKDSL